MGSAAWSHRWGTISWVAGAGVFLLYFGFAYQVSIRSYQGGAVAFGLAASAVADAMRPLAGAAERLDTYGGYTTYHNASYAALLLSLWAIIQGARAIRGWEERGGIEAWLATGKRRRAVVRDQWIGMLAALAVLAVGIGLGFGGGTVAAGATDWAGSIVVAVEMALVAATFFGIGMLASQLTGTARAAAGLSTMLMVALYLAANMAPNLGSFGWVRFLSPFFYFHQSNALVPGHSLDPLATAVLVAAAVTPVILAALAFERRDVAAPLWHRRIDVDAATTKRVTFRGLWMRDVWIADLRLQWLSLLLWALGSGLTMVLVVAVAKQVATVWESSELIRQLFVRVPEAGFVDQYMTYMTTFAAVAPVAFVIAEAARWVSDLSELRAEALLSISGSRIRIVLEWAMSTAAGVVVVSLGVLAGCLVGAAIAGVDLHADGLIRTTAASALLGFAVSGVALLAVAVFRNGAAVGALGALMGLAFFASLLAPMLSWPEWVTRLSPFDAFGTPYASVPRISGIALLMAWAIVGAFAAAVVAQRRASLT
ncbi:MAG: ABC transporter permease subunit [Candidatus Dormiibacterota bacterium]